MKLNLELLSDEESKLLHHFRLSTPDLQLTILKFVSGAQNIDAAQHNPPTLIHP